MDPKITIFNIEILQKSFLKFYFKLHFELDLIKIIVARKTHLQSFRQ